MLNKLFAIAIFVSLVAFAQAPGSDATTIILRAQPPPAVYNAGAQVVGTPGSRVYYYWVVAHYFVGNSVPYGPAQVTNAPNTLSGSNYVAISWPLNTAASYDILRTTTPALPQGTANIAVATGVTGSTVNDQSNSLSSYTVSAAGPAETKVALDNTNHPHPTGIFGGGFITPSLRANGVPTGIPCVRGWQYFQLDATAGSNIWLCTTTDTWTQLTGSGGGGGSTVITPGTGIVVTPSGGPSPYLIAIDPATVPTMGGSNVWTGSNNFTGSTVTGISSTPSTNLQIPVADTLSASVINTTPTAFATSYSIPANTLITGKSYRVTYNLAITTSATPVDIQFQLNLQKAGPTNVVVYYQNNAITPTAGPVTLYTSISFVVSATAIAGATAPTITGLTTIPLFSSAALTTGYRNFVVQPINVDTTATQAIQLRLIYSGNTAGNSVQMLSMLTEPLA